MDVVKVFELELQSIHLIVKDVIKWQVNQEELACLGLGQLLQCPIGQPLGVDHGLEVVLLIDQVHTVLYCKGLEEGGLIAIEYLLHKLEIPMRIEYGFLLHQFVIESEVLINDGHD